jgi:pimeloyl-ACP methyl ester carboxylesterase
VEKRIVLLHGWGARAEKLVPLEKQLKDTGWQTLNLDLPGFGLPEPKTAWNLADYSDYVLKKIPVNWGKDFFVFGHSFGGRIAIKLATTQPDKLKGIILCAPGGLSRAPLVKRVAFSSLAKIGRFLPFQEVFRRILYKVVREHDYEKTSGVMRQIFKNIVDEQLMPVVSRITLPTLIIWGDQDRVVPWTDGEKAHRIIKGSKLKIISNIGHRVPYDEPIKLAQLINIWIS